jgi:hypothetical protein
MFFLGHRTRCESLETQQYPSIKGPPVANTRSKAFPLTIRGAS